VEIGRLTERETKHGTVYLGGEILGLPVYIFPREDGSWRIFTPEDPPATIPPAGTPHVGEATDPLTEYTHTLDDVVIPDPGEPVRHQALSHRPEPTARRESTRPRRPRNQKGESRQGKDQ
jgi:hypothetical protein